MTAISPGVWQNFVRAARREPVAHPPVAFIAAGPWLPGYAQANLIDLYILPDKWFDVHYSLLVRFPDVVWLPGFWVEFGTAVEASAFGARIQFHPERPPLVHPISANLDDWVQAPLPNPQTDGLMAITIRRYLDAETRLNAQGLGIKMVASRGPFAIGTRLMGQEFFMNALRSQPQKMAIFLGMLTQMTISWLKAQLHTLRDPEGILLLDDTVGYLSVVEFQELAAGCMRQIFDAFDGLIRIYHNDTPCEHLFSLLTETNFDVFNFTHLVDIAKVKSGMGNRVALLGNLHQSELAVHGPPEAVRRSAQKILDKAAPGGGMILSVSGALYPGTPASTLDVMTAVAREWHES